MHVHFVIHESYEASGAYERWVRERNYTSGYSGVYAHEPLAQSAEGIDLLVVLGGRSVPRLPLLSGRISTPRPNAP